MYNAFSKKYPKFHRFKEVYIYCKNKIEREFLSEEELAITIPDFAVLSTKIKEFVQEKQKKDKKNKDEKEKEKNYKKGMVDWTKKVAYVKQTYKKDMDRKE